MVENVLDASPQSHSTSVASSPHRPVLTHLNADTTWLLSLPYPEGYEPPVGRKRFNILIDPWLAGPQSDVASWFSTQWHVIKSSVQTISELNELLAAEEIPEKTIAGVDQHRKKSLVDVVVISHEFTDHCHQATLQEVSPKVPVFATTKAAELIKSWGHFDCVIDMATFGEKTDWQTTSSSLLPNWLGISRLVTTGDALYYHSAVVICFQISKQPESLIYTPHGVEASTFKTMLTASPPVRNLALLHGLHDVSIWLSKQLNLGAFNAVEAAQSLDSQYWIGTHDEVKRGGGILAPFLRRKAWTMSDVISSRSTAGAGHKEQVNAQLEANTSCDPLCIELGSGESLILE